MDYKPCNANCCDYYCPKNVFGMCRAPNPCLGYKEARELMAELAETKRKLAEMTQLRAELRALIDACNIFHQSLESELDGHYDEIPHYLEASRDFLRDVAEAQAALVATSETKEENQ